MSLTFQLMDLRTAIAELRTGADQDAKFKAVEAALRAILKAMEEEERNRRSSGHYF